MKRRLKIFDAAIIVLTISMVILFSGCKKKDSEQLYGATTTYTLKVKDVLGVSGTVTFTEKSATETTISIAMSGGSSELHPAHIHMKSAIETGSIALTLNDVDTSGVSSTVVTHLDNGTAVSYNELINFDGYINVHQSTSSSGVIIAQADIGGNALTGTNRTYALTEVPTSGVTGTALFQQRKNGHTLITTTISPSIPGSVYPQHIHVGSVSTSGPITITLNDIDGTTGKAYTNVSKLDDNTAITYTGLMSYTGYLNVHASPTNLASILCHGNIGTH